MTRPHNKKIKGGGGGRVGGGGGEGISKRKSAPQELC